MEELAERGTERGTPGYVQESGNVKRSWDVADGGVEAAYSLREEARRPVLEQRAGGKASGSVWPVKKCVPLLNISSLQLIPVNMIAYRSQYGSVNPAGIIAPAIVATAVVYCKIKNRKQK